MSNVWEDVTLKGIKVFKWNVKLRHNVNVDENEGLLVLRRSPDRHIWHVLPFDLGSMVQHPSDPNGYFVPRSKSLTFFWSLFKPRCFQQDVVHELAQELQLFIMASFQFNALTLICPSGPMLVFVVDMSYTERLVDEIELYSDEDEDSCDDDSFDDDECIPEDERTTTDEMEGDVEDEYSEEKKDLVWELRKHYNVEWMYPLEPLSKEEPLGLVEARKKLEIVVVEGDAVSSSPCAFCLDCLAAKHVAVKTKCGHLFHKKCSLSWFGSEFTCPMCRSNTRSIV